MSLTFNSELEFFLYFAAVNANSRPIPRQAESQPWRVWRVYLIAQSFARRRCGRHNGTVLFCQRGHYEGHRGLLIALAFGGGGGGGLGGVRKGRPCGEVLAFKLNRTLEMRRTIATDDPVA